MAEAAAGGSVMTAAEYSASVASWLEQAYQWQMIAVGFPSYLAYQAHLQSQRSDNDNGDQEQTRNRQTNSNQPRQRPQQQQQQQQPQRPSNHFRVPPIWKRFAAEFIDFLALFVIKLVVTFVAVDTFNLIDLEEFMSRYDSSIYTLAAGKELDMASALELTSDIVFLELMLRVVVCIFEAVCTFRGAAGSPGGATPGKLVMGLRIFKCDQVR